MLVPATHEPLRWWVAAVVLLHIVINRLAQLGGQHKCGAPIRSMNFVRARVATSPWLSAQLSKLLRRRGEEQYT